MVGNHEEKKITTLFGLKGGVGRTRVARELVDGMRARGVEVGALDLTGFGSFARLHDVREEGFKLEALDHTSVTAMGQQPPDVRALIDGIFVRSAHVIVDTIPHPAPVYEAALMASDVIVLPTSPGEELRDLPRSIAVVREVQQAQAAAGSAPARVLVLFLWRHNDPVPFEGRERLLDGTGFDALPGAAMSCGELPWIQRDLAAFGGFPTTRALLEAMYGPSSHALAGVDRIIEEVLGLHGESWPLPEPEW